MNNVTKVFKQLYNPKYALVIYQHVSNENECYVESYDIDKTGRPTNAHPLSDKEAEKLAKKLVRQQDQNQKKEKPRSYLKSEGMLSERVLFVNTEADGYAIWYTPATEQNLFFINDLGIPNGKAHVPALLWRATRSGSLHLYALKSDKRPTVKTKLHHAPFFNIDTSGRVCMGTVQRNFPDDCSLETFIDSWQTYFFNSYFSHANGHAMTKTNIVQIWKGQIDSGQPYPTETLIASKTTLQSLLPAPSKLKALLP